MDTSDQSNGQASRLPNGVPFSPSTEEAWLARMRQYWEDQKLDRETAKNIGFSQNTTREEFLRDRQSHICKACSLADADVTSTGHAAIDQEERLQANVRQYWDDKKGTDQTAKTTESNKSTSGDQGNNGQASHLPNGVPLPPDETLETCPARKSRFPPPAGITEEAWLARERQYREEKKRTNQTAKTTESNKSTSGDQGNNGQASRLPNGVPLPPDETLETWLARKSRFPPPAGVTEEAWLARKREYWEDQKLADETAKNTEFNKNLGNSDQANRSRPSPPSSKTKQAQEACNRQSCEEKKLADQTLKNSGCNNIKWADLSHPIQP